MSSAELRTLTVGSVLNIKRVDEVNVRVNGKAAFTGSFGQMVMFEPFGLQMFCQKMMC